MIVPWHAIGLGDLLVFDRGLQDHALGELLDHAALDLLPGRLAGRIGVAAAGGEIGSTPLQLLRGHQDIGGALIEVDPDAVARLQEREAAPRCRLRGG